VQKVTRTEEASFTVRQGGEKVAETNDSELKEVLVKTTEKTEKRLINAVDQGSGRGKCSGGITSLVADYSDSDSDPGQ